MTRETVEQLKARLKREEREKEEFEQEWPQMRTQMLRERALEGDSAVRREQRERSLKAF
jgi:hypothetical protein